MQHGEFRVACPVCDAPLLINYSLTTGERHGDRVDAVVAVDDEALAEVIRSHFESAHAQPAGSSAS